jgi:hypothetical protein
VFRCQCIRNEEIGSQKLQRSSVGTFSRISYPSLMKCAIPAFEGLLPEPYNSQLLTLLFHLVEWHALAKLRLHTEFTLTHMDQVTTVLGQEL